MNRDFEFDFPLHVHQVRKVRKLATMADRLSIGSVLKAARQAKKVRQTEIAKQAGLSSAALSHVEAGRNQPTIGTLQAYAHFVVASDDQEEFLRILRGSDLLPLPRLAELISPADPDNFLLLYDDARRRGSMRSDMSSGRSPEVLLESELSAPNLSFSRLTSRQLTSDLRISNHETLSHRPSVDAERVLATMRDFLALKGGRPIVPGGPTSDLGFGVQVACDLIEMTRSLVVELKSLDRLVDQETIELMGKTSLLKMHDYEFVVCLISRPTEASHLRAVDMLRRAGAKIVWPNPDAKTAESPFNGDTIV